jgi:biotin carboxyl carrier protein
MARPSRPRVVEGVKTTLPFLAQVARASRRAARRAAHADGGPGRFAKLSLDKERSMPEEIKAHITGVVFQIPAKTGRQGRRRRPVIVLESMKMEIPVEAPRAGVVKEIKVAEGQTVQEGETVAVLE